MKREDYELVRSFEDKLFLALRPDYFDGSEEEEIEITLQDLEDQEYDETFDKMGLGQEPEVEALLSINEVMKAAIDLDPPEVVIPEPEIIVHYEYDTADETIPEIIDEIPVVVDPKDAEIARLKALLEDVEKAEGE